MDTTKVNHMMFQFHNGSIKGKDGNGGRIQVHVFQFHNGSIKGARPHTDHALDQYVSIPQWFD